MSVKYIEHEDLKTVELIVDGKVSKDDFDEIVPQIENFIERHEKIKILEIIKSFTGVQLTALGEGILFDMKHFKNFTHCAVVCDDGWIGPFTRTMAPFFKIEIKTFHLNELKDARNWLENA